MTRLAGRLAFDRARGEIRDEARRYLMLRADVLMGAMRRMDPLLRRHAQDAFASSVAQHGRDSVTAYLAHLGGDRVRLLDAMQDAAADLGWGRWQLQLSTTALQLQVENSPFAMGFGVSSERVCGPIRGMLQALAELVAGSATSVRELACASQGAAACVFEAALREPGRG